MRVVQVLHHMVLALDTLTLASAPLSSTCKGYLSLTQHGGEGCLAGAVSKEMWRWQATG